METSSDCVILRINKRLFDLTLDYAIISTWWIQHGSFVPHEEHLPKTGIVIEYDNKPVCVGFLYKTDSRLCIFEFVVSDPKAEKDIRDKCLNNLISEVIIWSEENNFNLIYTSIAIPKYIQRLKTQGFIEADKNQTHMFKVI